MAHDQLSRRRWLESVSIIGLSLLTPSGVRTAVAQSSPQSYLDALRAGGAVRRQPRHRAVSVTNPVTSAERQQLLGGQASRYRP